MKMKQISNFHFPCCTLLSLSITKEKSVCNCGVSLPFIRIGYFTIRWEGQNHQPKSLARILEVCSKEVEHQPLLRGFQLAYVKHLSNVWMCLVAGLSCSMEGVTMQFDRSIKNEKKKNKMFNLLE